MSSQQGKKSFLNTLNEVRDATNNVSRSKVDVILKELEHFDQEMHDDLIMACAVGCWVRDTALSVSQRDAEYSKAFIGAITKTGNNLDTRIKGMVGTQKLKMSDSMNKHAKAVTDFPWLFKG